MEYVIITDSATDLPQEIRTEFNLHVIPTPVVINEKVCFDGEDIKTDTFYNLLEDSSNTIETFHINPDMFEKAFRPYAEKGQRVIYPCFSTGVAGTFNAANVAKQNVLEDYPDFQLDIIDSKCASMGFGLMVYKLLLMQRAGAKAELVIEAAEFYSRHIKHVFTVETLEYLIKGGRLGKVTGGVAETLDVKPLIIIDENGSLKVNKLVRGRKSSFKGLIKYVQDTGFNLEKQTIGMCHGEDKKAIDEVISMVKDKIRPEKIIESIVGCAIGAHTGRGIIGIVFLDASDEKYMNI